MLLATIPLWKRVLPHVFGLIAAIGFFYLWSVTGQVLFSSLKCLGYTAEYCEYLFSLPNGTKGIEFMILAVLLSQVASYLVVWYLIKLVLGTTRRQRHHREFEN
jgi:hypothetical protein